MSDDDSIIGYDAYSDNGFVIEEDASSIDAYDGSNYLSDNFSEEEEDENLKIKFSAIKKTKPTSYTVILHEEDDFI